MINKSDGRDADLLVPAKMRGNGQLLLKNTPEQQTRLTCESHLFGSSCTGD